MGNKIIQAFKNINYKDIAERLLWTFVQAFLAVCLLTSESIIDLLFKGDWTGLYAVIIATAVAGVSAGLSAVKGVIVQLINELKAKA